MSTDEMLMNLPAINLNGVNDAYRHVQEYISKEEVELYKEMGWIEKEVEFKYFPLEASTEILLVYGDPTMWYHLYFPFDKLDEEYAPILWERLKEGNLIYVEREEVEKYVNKRVN